MADVEMKPAADDKPKGDKNEEQDQADTKPTPPSPLAEIKFNIALLEKAVSTLEPRFTRRVLRTFTTLRKKLDDGILRDAIEETYPKGSSFAFHDLSAIPNIS
jgi:26S proteasome regulatory subunit N3